MKKAFTILELLVVIAVIALLLGILLPSLRQARLQGKILAVNAELRQIGLALECYFMEHKEYPPTREDCNTGTLDNHLFQLPDELAEGDYLPKSSDYEAMSTVMEDRFHPGHTYKYRSVGECIRDRNIIDARITSRLWVPDGFPAASSIEEGRGQWFNEVDKCPVSWVLFSVGPDFDEQLLRDTVGNRYPVPREIWYNPRDKRGFIVRMHMKNGNEYGSFEGRK